jgi:hypothetical protein
MPGATSLWQIWCRLPLESAGAPDSFFEPCLSFARQTREPRDELVDCSVKVFVHCMAVNVTSGQSQPCAGGKHPVCAGFLAEHNLCAQNVPRKPRQTGDFLLDKLPQRDAKFDYMRHYVDR